MATSPIYSWPEPDNTDLVKNGALAIRTLGDAIDTTMGTMVAKTIIDAKGDLIAGSAADTALRLAVGTNGQTLVADSTAATGLKWATPAAGGGKVLQVVNATTQTGAGNSTSTYADTNLTATITPTSATSKILVLVSQNGCGKNTSDTSVNLILLRGASTIVTAESAGGWTNSTAHNYIGGISINYLDSPATTSATTYKTQYKSYGNNARVYVNTGQGATDSTSSITLLEIGA
jgi:hypothetical protein